MERYDWPGNVRELCNVVQRAWILCEGKSITQPILQRETVLGDVTPATAFTVTIGESLAEVERRLILHTVQRCRTREEAARILKISTKTLYNKLRVYEAGARWRDNHGIAAVAVAVTGQHDALLGTAWDRHDATSRCSEHRGATEGPDRGDVVRDRLLARGGSRDDRAGDEALVAGPAAYAEGPLAQSRDADGAAAAGGRLGARDADVLRAGGQPARDERCASEIDAMNRNLRLLESLAGWQELHDEHFCEVHTNLAEVLQAVRVEAARRQVQVRLDVMPEPTLIVCTAVGLSAGRAHLHDLHDPALPARRVGGHRRRDSSPGRRCSISSAASSGGAARDEIDYALDLDLLATLVSMAGARFVPWPTMRVAFRTASH